MATSVGSLFASLTLQSDQFVQGTQKASQASKTMSTTIGNAFEEVALKAAKYLTIGVIVDKFIEGTKSAFDYAASLTDLARKVGTTVEQYQVLEQASKQTGVSQEKLNTGIEKLNATLGKAQAGNKDAIETFKQIGIPESSLKSFNDAYDILPKVMDGMKGLSTHAQQSTESVKLMGKAGNELTGTLGEGAAAMDDWKAAAERVGIITDEQAAKARMAKLEFEELSDTLRNHLAIALADNIPAFAALGKSMANAITGLGMLINFFRRASAEAHAFFSAIAHLNNPFSAMNQADKDLEAADNNESLAARFSVDRGLGAQGSTGGDNNLDLSSHRAPKKPKAATTDPAAELIKKLTFDNTSEDQLLKIDPTDTSALREWNTQKDIFNNLQSAGKKATDAQKDSITALTRSLDDKKALEEWNKDMEQFIANAKEATDTMGMDQFQKTRFDILKKAKERPDTAAPAGPNDIVVTAHKVDPETQRALDAVADQQHANSQQLVKDLNEETMVMGLSDKEQYVYNELKKAGVDVNAADAEAIKAAAAAHYDEAKAIEASGKKLEDMKAEADKLAGIGVGLFDSLISGTSNWKQAFSDAIKSLGQEMIRYLVEEPLKKMLASGFLKILEAITGTGGIPNPFAGGGGLGGVPVNIGDTNLITGVPTGSAMGGDAMAGSPYWVGEKGPEMFVPSSSGSIIPNSQLGGGGQNVVFNIDARGSTNEAEVRNQVQQGIMEALPLLNQSSYSFTLRKLARPAPLST